MFYGLVWWIVDRVFDLVFFLTRGLDVDSMTEYFSKPFVAPTELNSVSLFVSPEVIDFIIGLELAWFGFKMAWAIGLRIKSFIPGISGI